MVWYVLVKEFMVKGVLLRYKQTIKQEHKNLQSSCKKFMGRISVMIYVLIDYIFVVKQN